MAPKVRHGFWIKDEQLKGLRFIKTRDGVLESEQIRRAIDAWLETKGIKKAERPRAATRQRS